MDDTKISEQQEDQQLPIDEGVVKDTQHGELKQPNKQQKRKVETITLSDHKAAVNALQTEIDSLKTQLAALEQYKPQEKSEAEIQLEQIQQSLFAKEIELELKAANLYEFKDFFKVGSTEQLTEMIKSFQELLNKRKVPMGFIPNDHKPQNKYSQAKSQGNVRDMIKAKLFG